MSRMAAWNPFEANFVEQAVHRGLSVEEVLIVITTRSRAAVKQRMSEVRSEALLRRDLAVVKRVHDTARFGAARPRRHRTACTVCGAPEFLESYASDPHVKICRDRRVCRRRLDGKPASPRARTIMTGRPVR